MMKKTRKIRRQPVKENVAEISPWDLSGTAHDIYKELQETQNAYVDKYNIDDIISISWEWESASDESLDGHFILTIMRLENDTEYNARVHNLMKIKDGERAAKEKEQKNEYEEYLRLKKKYGDKDSLPHLAYQQWKNDWSSP